MTTSREQYIEGLRQLAQVLEDNPGIPLPYTGQAGRDMTIGFYGTDAREQMAIAARALPCAWTKGVSRDEKWFELHGQLGGGFAVELYASREMVCTRRVTGVEDREVEEEVTPAVTRKVVKPVEVVTWDCGSLLAPASGS